MTNNLGYESAEARTHALRVPRMTRDAGLRMGKMRFGYECAYGDGISRDPIGEEKGGINLYAYVLNNTVNAMDALGLWTLTSLATNFALGVAVGLGTAVGVAFVTVAATAVLPVAAVTVGLAVLAGVGAAAVGYDIVTNASTSNWNKVAFDAGTLGGGALFGAAGGGSAMQYGMTGQPSAVPWSWNPFADTSLGYDSKFPGGSIWGRLASAPTPQSAAGIATSIGSGLDSALYNPDDDDTWYDPCW